MSNVSCPLETGRPPGIAGGLPITLQSNIPPPRLAVTLRAARLADVDQLEALELRAFTHDRIARRSFVRFLVSPNAALIVADGNGVICGYALVLFRARSQLARLYSIAVDAKHAGHQLGSRLLSAAEDVAYRCGSSSMRLEVGESNMPARKLYRTFGYSLLERLLGYYEDGTDALRFQKFLGR